MKLQTNSPSLELQVIRFSVTRLIHFESLQVYNDITISLIFSCPIFQCPIGDPCGEDIDCPCTDQKVICNYKQVCAVRQWWDDVVRKKPVSLARDIAFPNKNDRSKVSSEYELLLTLLSPNRDENEISRYIIITCSNI